MLAVFVAESQPTGPSPFSLPLGVPDQVFVDLMDAQLRNYNEAMRDKSTAVRLLKTYIDENDMTSTIAQMILDGFMDTKEPFVQTLLHLWRSWSVKALKEKAQLVIDDGAFVLGCVDETGTLRGHDVSIEGRGRVEPHQLPQIFLQVPNRREGATGYKIVTEPVSCWAQSFSPPRGYSCRGGCRCPRHFGAFETP